MDSAQIHPTPQGDRSTDVLIVGAGPVGLAAAAALVGSGVRVEVCERDPGPISQSRALLVQPRTLEHFAALGIGEKAVAEGQSVRRVEVYAQGKPSGALWYEGVGRSPFPHGLVLEQSKTQRLLLGELDRLGVQPHWGHTLECLTQGLDEVRAELRDSDGASTTVHARYVIGADGAASTVRHIVGGSFDGRTYGASFFLADTTLDTSLDHDRIYISVTRTDFHAFFPMAGERRWRVIGTLQPDEVERYVGGGDALGATGDIGREDLERLVAVTGLPVTVRDVSWATGYRIHQRMVQHYRHGRIFLAGDAAHIHSPAGGQGMNTGIGDAINLAWKLAAVVHGQADPTLLDTYHAERAPVARKVLRQADQLFRLEAGQSRIAGAARIRVLPLLAASLSSTPAARRVFFDRLSQIATSYRTPNPGLKSCWRRRDTGAVVGDRLPYQPLDESGTSHDLLAAPHHALIVVPGDTDTDQLATVGDRWRSMLDGFALPIDLRLLAGPQTQFRRAVAHPGPFAILVRPDGYIAHIANVDDTQSLASHLRGYARPAGGAADDEAPRAASAPQSPKGNSLNRPATHPLPEAGRYLLGAGPAAARLTVSHMFGLGTVEATVDLAGGAIQVTDPPASSRVKARLDAASFTSGNHRRDRSVRGRGLLDTTRWPDITFSAGQLDATADAEDGIWRARGTLTVHGRKHPVVVDVTLDTVETDGFTLHARATLDRRDLGVTGKPGMIGNQISLEVKAHAVADPSHADHSPSSPPFGEQTQRALIRYE